MGSALIEPLTIEAEEQPALPPLRITPQRVAETRLTRWLGLVLATVIVLVSFLCTAAFRVPAHPGVDHNGYLMGGRMMASQGSTRYSPINPDTGAVDPFLFVGKMWVGAELGTERERYYPKYPIGLPALVAVMLKLGGPERGLEWTYWISPIAMASAIAATFLLVRLFAGSFAGLLAAAVMASSPVTMNLANNPNSHGATIFFVSWGMFLLMSWWIAGGWWRAGLAGFCIGYAATIRYTEALLLLPMLFVIAERAIPELLPWNWTWARRWGGYPPIEAPRPRKVSLGQAALVLLGWTAPVAVLLIFNLRAIGTLTGYDPTRESAPGSAFKFEHFQVNWHTMVEQLHDNGLIFILPFAVAGLIWMMRAQFRLALALALWILPCAAVYSFYYFAPESRPLSYMRFFLTIFPALILCAFFALSRLRIEGTAGPRATQVAAGVLAALAVLMGTTAGIELLGPDQHGRFTLRDNASEIQRALAGVEDGRAVVLTGEELLIHHLQFATSHAYYSTQSFNERPFGNPERINHDPDDPTPLDPARRAAVRTRIDEMLAERLSRPESFQARRRLAEAKDEEEKEKRRLAEIKSMLLDEQRKIVRSALEGGRKVFIAGPERFTATTKQVLKPAGLELHVVSRWFPTVIPPPSRDRPSSLRGTDKIRRDKFSNPLPWEVVEVRLKGPPATQPVKPAKP